MNNRIWSIQSGKPGDDDVDGDCYYYRPTINIVLTAALVMMVIKSNGVNDCSTVNDVPQGFCCNIHKRIIKLANVTIRYRPMHFLLKSTLKGVFILMMMMIIAAATTTTTTTAAKIIIIMIIITIIVIIMLIIMTILTLGASIYISPFHKL